MTRTTRYRSILSISLASAGLWLASACGGEAPEGSEYAEMGTLEVPLIASVNGHTYRLNGTIYVYDPRYYVTSLFTSDPAETTLSRQLQSGRYTAELSPSWTLERADAAGAFAPVSARLTSSAVVAFEVRNGSASTVTYRFETDGISVIPSVGDLNVRVAVSEIAGICAPLGEGCAHGTWCAPPELTGAALACIPAGTAAVGDPCVDPGECSANSSCVDLGQGPVCAQLCAAAAFDSACASGGTCQPAGLTYGICRPSAPAL